MEKIWESSGGDNVKNLHSRGEECGKVVVEISWQKYTAVEIMWEKQA